MPLRMAVVAVAVLSFAVSSLAQTIGPGSKAPAMDVRAWLKGSPVSRLEPGKTYVVEFWSTTCGFSRAAIPQISELARQNPDVTFVGVSVFETNEDGRVQKFVDRMGAKMDYRVGWSGEWDRMAKTWMTSAARNGVPTVFIVKDLTIEWIGAAADMEKPLEQIKAGTFDRAAHRAEFDKTVAPNLRAIAMTDEYREIEKLFRRGRRDDAHRRLETYAAKYPEDAASVESTQFRWLAVEDPEAWQVLASELSNSKEPPKLRRLTRFALDQADPKKGNRKLADTAIALAIKGSEGKSLSIYNFVLSYYEQSERFGKALETISAMEKLVAGLPKSDQGEWLSALAERRKVATEENAHRKPS